MSNGKGNSSEGGEGYGMRLGVNNGAVNRVSSQSLADVYDSYYDGSKRMSNMEESTYIGTTTSSAYDNALVQEEDRRYPRMV